jgi:hypothetical protein
MANKRTYTDAELAYIKRYYPTCNTQSIADELGWTERKVKRVAIYHGFSKKVHHSKKAPKPFVIVKINKKPQVVDLDMVDKDRIDFVVKTGSLINGNIKIYGTTADCYKNIPNPQPSDYIHSGRYAEELEKAKHDEYVFRLTHGDLDALAPAGIDVVNLNPKRPNLFQRIIGFLLRGDW